MPSVGAFPCQNISLAGRMEGIDGAKSGLWQHYRRLIQELRPRWVIIENSPVLRSRGLETMLSELTALGYDAEWHCLPANAFGAPHRRDRLWVVAYPTGGRDGLPPLEISTGWDQSQHLAWWHTEPAVGRVVDGISAEPHRLAQLGNAVVPRLSKKLGGRFSSRKGWQHEHRPDHRNLGRSINGRNDCRRCLPAPCP
ncbi:DNA cytosine methyltransferase [Sphingomonas mollis]